MDCINFVSCLLLADRAGRHFKNVKIETKRMTTGLMIELFVLSA